MSPQSPPEVPLIEQARRGSSSAFSALVSRHQAAVRAFLSARLGDPDQADDLSQEVFLAAYRGIERFREESAFGTWLLAIAKRLAATHVRAQVRRRRLEGAHLEAALLEWRGSRDATSPSTLSCEEERLRALRGCLGDLPEPSHGLVRAHYFEGRSLASIAASRGRTAGSLRMQLSRARRALADCVRRKLRTGEATDGP